VDARKSVTYRVSNLLLLTALVGAQPLGCASGQTTASAPERTTVLVRVAESPERPTDGAAPRGIDFEDPRIAVAGDALKKQLGHPLSFEIEPPLVPQFGSSLHSAFVAALETAVSSLEEFKAEHPDAMAYVAPYLKVISFKYTPSDHAEDPELDMASGRLVTEVVPNTSVLLQPGDIYTAFKSAFERERVARYSNIDPAQILPAEQATYLDFITTYRRPEKRNGVEPPYEQVQLERIDKLLAFYPYVKDPKVRDETRHDLVGEGDRLVRLYNKPPEAASVRSLLQQMHNRWMVWLNAHRDELSPRERKNVAELMFDHD
jgi:hypothetical protein